ncbi:MAG: cob(II)yrinic acid a,c-diamide reductase 1 [Planctomycetaceae bacterium]|nr:cob(II)yrinic acid a,c-diamide reductase 1 [Planctomycetaceae bacterium]
MELYEAIYGRRDVRRFQAEQIADDVLARILDAAHHAGSVGFMQPWNFIVVRSLDVRQQVYELFTRENARAAENYTGERRELYDSLKLAGILEAPVSVAVTCDRSRNGPAVLGKNSMPEMDLYSTCCAIQNLWLAARSEGIGVGWVSILDPTLVKPLLGIPDDIVLVAWLCLGIPVQFDDRPMLETVGWEKRLPLEEVVFAERWQERWAADSSK